MNSTPKILIIAPAWVGDMVLTHSLVRVLKHKHPQAQIDIAAPAWTLPLASRMPEVNASIELPFSHGKLALSARYQLAKQLRRVGYDQALVLPNSWKSALVPWLAHIPLRTGYSGELRLGLLNDRRTLNKNTSRTVDRFVSLGLAPQESLPNIPLPQLVVDTTVAKRLQQQLGLRVGKVLALCPGAEYGESKRWPIPYYAQVANVALNAGWQVWLLGSAKDSVITAQIKCLATDSIDLAGKTRLLEVVDLMSLANAVVSNDSGLMHIAAALGKYLVAIFGASTPQQTPPMSTQAIVEYLALSCSPCFARQCPLQHHACLTQIKPEQVLVHLNL